MNYLWFLGLLMFLAAGGLLHDVPFVRFIAAVLLITVGTVFVILGNANGNS